MRINSICGVVMIFILICPVMYARAQEDLIGEGEQVIEESMRLINEGEKIKDSNTPDRAWLVDQGYMLIEHGMDVIETGAMMYTDQGRSSMDEIGTKFRQSGGMLLKIGRQKGELTQEEKAALKKEGAKMIKLGETMLEKGKLMAGK